MKIKSFDATVAYWLISKSQFDWEFEGHGFVSCLFMYALTWSSYFQIDDNVE